MNIEYYNKALQPLLQSRVTFKCDNKTLKTGKLMLFNIKQYFIKFYIETDKGESKILELPYPFNMSTSSDNICTLNYKLSSLCNNMQPILNRLRLCKTGSTHKIYDSVVSIIPLS